MERGVWAYPWDLAAEPDCARRHEEMGLTYVCVAARYHAVRAIGYLPSGPRITSRVAGSDCLSEAADLATRYSKTNVALNAWIVCFHEDPAPEGERVVNCLGDEYPWASCPRNPEARKRILSFIEAAASLGVFRALELEAFGFYGFVHGSEHDKTPLPNHPQLEELLSVCCCRRCREATGLAPEVLAPFAADIIVGRRVAPSDAIAEMLQAQAAARQSYEDDLLREAMDRVAGRALVRLQVTPNRHAFGPARPVPKGDVQPNAFVVPVWSQNPEHVRDAAQEVRTATGLCTMAGFAAIPPYCTPQDIGSAIQLIGQTRPDGVCAYHDGMMHPDARRAYANALAAQS